MKNVLKNGFIAMKKKLRNLEQFDMPATLLGWDFLSTKFLCSWDTYDVFRTSNDKIDDCAFFILHGEFWWVINRPPLTFFMNHSQRTTLVCCYITIFLEILSSPILVWMSIFFSFSIWIQLEIHQNWLHLFWWIKQEWNMRIDVILYMGNLLLVIPF